MKSLEASDMAREKAPAPKKLRDLWPVSRTSSRDGIAWTANTRWSRRRKSTARAAAQRER